MDSSVSIRRIQRALVIAFVLTLVATFYYLAWHGHPSSDDFYHAWTVKKQGGVLSAVRWMYFTYEGRFLTNLLTYGWFTLFPPPSSTRVLLLLAVTAVCALPFLVRQLQPPERKTPLGTCWLLLFAYLGTVPSICQVLFFQNAIFLYTLAQTLFVLTAILAWRMRKAVRVRRGRVVLLLTLCFAVSGLNEVVMSTLAVYLLVLALIHLAEGKRPPTWLWAALGVTVAVGAVVLSAPGFARRAEAVPAGRDWTRTIPLIAWLFGVYGLKSLVYLTAVIGASGKAPGLLRRLREQAPKVLPSRKAAWVVIWGFPVLLATTLFIPVHALGTNPPARAVSVYHMVFFVGVLPWAFAWARVRPRLFQLELPPRLQLVWFGLSLALLCSFGLLPALWRDLPLVEPFHEQMLRRYERVETAGEDGQQTLVLRPLIHHPRTLYLKDLSSNPRYYSNKSAAQLWELEKIRVARRPGTDQYDF